MTVSTITKKVFAFLTLYPLLNFFLTSNLYAKDSLPTIKNDTPWKVKFDYSWIGCGSSNKYKNKAGDGSYFDPAEHTSNKKVSPHDTLTVTTDCFSRHGTGVVITPYNLSNKFLGYLSIGLINGNTISCKPVVCVCKSELCEKVNGDWQVPRNKVLPTLQYDTSKKNKYNGYSGYYWYMDIHQ